MSRRPARQPLDDMLERIERIKGFVAGFDRNGFLRDPKTSDSVVRNLEVIGEAASRVDPGIRSRHSEIPWARIVGLRHRIVHSYFDVDLELVWQIVREELPGLDAKLREMSSRLEDPDRRNE